MIMKKLYVLITALLGVLGSQAQTADNYVPLVREGVKWIYAYVPMYDESGYYSRFSVEIRGEIELDGVEYKQCWRTYIDTNNSHNEGETELLAYVREEGKCVYAVLPNHDSLSHTNPGIAGEKSDEWLVYDFNDIPTFYSKLPKETFYTLQGPIERGFEAQETDFVSVNGKQCKAWAINEPELQGTLVEGYGMLGDMHDQLFDPYFRSFNAWSGSNPMTCGVYSIVEDGKEVYHFADYDSMMPNDTPTINADVNGDGSVDINDVNAVINILLAQ